MLAICEKFWCSHLQALTCGEKGERSLGEGVMGGVQCLDLSFRGYYHTGHLLSIPSIGVQMRAKAEGAEVVD